MMNVAHRRYGLGLMIGLVWMLAMTVVGASSTAAQEGNRSSLVLYAYACPAGFTGDDYDQCRTTPLAGVSYTAFAAGQDNGVGATTDGDGVAILSLSALGGGTINVAMSPLRGYESAFVACSEEHGAIESGITFADLAPHAFVTCQWYFVPTDGNRGDGSGGGEDGSMTITTYACPEAWDGEDYAACREHPQEGVTFTVAAQGTDNGVGATTDANGLATLTLFTADLPGNINVVENLPAGYATFEAACQTEPGIAADYAYTGTGITLSDVRTGQRLRAPGSTSWPLTMATMIRPRSPL